MGLLRSLRWGTPLAVLLLAFGVLTALNASSEAPARSEGPRSERDALVNTGYRALQRARETAANEQFELADESFAKLIERDPKDVDGLVGLGTLAMSRHDFRGAYGLATTARSEHPEVVRSFAVLVDSQVELGRYQAAERTLQQMVDARPDLAAYARVSFLRELRGDLDGAASALRFAISAGGDASENSAYVQSLLGHVDAIRGRRGPARRSYERALARVPRYVPAQAGLARLDAGAGNLRSALRRMRQVVADQPLPEHVITLGELELLAGDTAAARRRFDEQRATMSRLGSNEDAGLALLEAEHGDRVRAVRVGRRSWSRAPSVHSADALGWALTRAGRPAEGLRWAREALRLGSRDPLFLTRAGLSAQAAGDAVVARRLLRRAVARDPRFSAVWAPRARAALRELDSADQRRSSSSAR